MKFKKILFCFLTILILATNFISLKANAAVEVGDIINNMSAAGDATGISTDQGIGKVINIIIGLLQVAGSGISILVVTMLGVKYILASVEEKAEIKKHALPIVIGCVLLFGAVNLMAALEEFTHTTVQNP